ncbi:MAG: hypothetical protein WCT46_03360 [Candidatus Gracilibacteria bacterium]|jgi:hypothetical protein
MTESFEVGDAPKRINWSLFTRFLVFFIVSGAVFSIFLWVVFLKSVLVDTSLKSEVVVYQNGAISDVLFEVGTYSVSDNSYEVLFDGIDLMRFTSGSEFSLDDISENQGFYTVSITLNKGEVWVANMGGVLDLKVKSGDFMLQNVDGYYYVENDSENVFAYAYKHPCRVYFLDDNGISLNSYLIPEGYYIDFGLDSVDSVVSDLRYAKLVKDYPFYSLTSSEERDFFAEFVSADDSRYQSMLSDFKVLVRENYDIYNSEGVSAKIGAIIDFLRDKLTFSQTKKVESGEQNTLKSLNQALYLSVKGDSDSATTVLMSVENGSVYGDEYISYLSYLNVVLNNSLYGDELYAVKNYLRGLLYDDTNDGKIVVLRDRLNEIYDLVNSGEIALAKTAFSDYERGWWDFLGMSSDELSSYRKDISEERELLSVLLLNSDGFYDIKYFNLLESFEEAIFKVAVSGTDLDEERQAFVASKVKALNKIEDLLIDNNISVESATDLMVLLLESSDVLMDEIESDAAILSYYQQEIDHGWIVVQFINSVEYSSLSGSFDENLDAYVQKVSDIEELKSYQQGFHLGASETSDLTLDEAKVIVEADLDAVEVIYDSISSVGDSAYRLFEIIGGSLNGVDFEAKYDRESQLIYDLVVGDAKFTTGIRLADLAGVLNGAVSGGGESEEPVVDDSVKVKVGDTSESELSYSEQVAVGLLKEYLSDYQIEIDESNVSDFDVENNVFTLVDVIVGEKSVDFVIYLESWQISGVVVDGEEVEVEGIEDLR